MGSHTAWNVIRASTDGADNEISRIMPYLEKLESNPAASLIKKSGQRSVWKINVAVGELVYAKVYHDPAFSIAHWAKRVLRFHPAYREWATLMDLRERGIRTVHPIAIVRPVRARPKESGAQAGTVRRLILLTNGFEPSTNLTQAWEGVRRASGGDRARHSRAVLLAVSELWASCHDRGYAHPDGHPGNVLIRRMSTSGIDSWEAAFVDPASTTLALRRKGPVSLERALRSLAMLNQYFSRTASRSERLRFWRDYWIRRGKLMGRETERKIIERFLNIVAVHRCALARQRDRRLKGDGRYFQRLRVGNGWSGVVVLRLGRRHVFEEAGFTERSIGEWESLLANAVRIGSGRERLPGGIRVKGKPPTKNAGWAREAFERSHRLRHRDIQTSLVLGYLEQKSGARITEEMLILPEGKGGLVT